MRKTLLLILLVLVYASTNAQDSASTKILLVPFNPDMYLSDIEQDIIQNTKMTPNEYRAYFRRTLDLKLQGELKSYSPTVSLMGDEVDNDKKELREFYVQAGYSYMEPVGKGLGKITDKKKSIFEKKTAEDKAPLYITTRGDDKFMNAVISDKTYFSELMTANNCNYMASINQLEFKTNYSSCIDLSRQIYRRELIIHYSIWDSSAKLLEGNFLVVYFPSDLNKPQEIAEKTFKSISEAFLTQLKGAIGN
ncbi:MAG: hypothetical protein ACK5B3_00255 [Bacteroidota bacterium]|jgi:hypothetical protein